jgi:hypothetical protein
MGVVANVDTTARISETTTNDGRRWPLVLLVDAVLILTRDLRFVVTKVQPYEFANCFVCPVLRMT